MKIDDETKEKIFGGIFYTIYTCALLGGFIYWWYSTKSSALGFIFFFGVCYILAISLFFIIGKAIDKFLKRDIYYNIAATIAFIFFFVSFYFSYPYWTCDFANPRLHMIADIEASQKKTDNSPTVYETPYGECYHRESCRCIQGHDIYAVKKCKTFRRPCKVCRP